MPKHIDFMEKFFIFYSTVLCINLSLGQSLVWDSQPKLSLNTQKNITYINPSTKKTKTIFPVMLYSFNGWDEIKSTHDWSFLKTFGVNIMYSWDVHKQDIFLRKANESETLVLLNHSSLHLKSYFFSFPDEPIGAGTASLKELNEINTVLKKDVLRFINIDVGPYYYRKQKETNKNIDIFQSKYNCSWCAHGKGSVLSYDETVQHASIVSFDYYPFRSNGNIDNNVNTYGKSSVGEFTKLLKKKYPDKSIWAVIQTLWFDPFSDKYQGVIINSKIIRNLTFDAIINGADGISFFGHGQTKEYQEKKGYEFLKNKDLEIWKATLHQTFELGQLQENYDSILLQDNIYNFADKNKGYSFSIKKVPNEKKYYIFVVNHLKKNNDINLNLPKYLNTAALSKIKKLGTYSMPELQSKWSLEKKDFTKELQIKSLKNNILNIKLEEYSVGIVTFTL